jgi:hypothetical protein
MTWEGVPMDLQLSESNFTWAIVQKIADGLRTESKTTIEKTIAGGGLTDRL